MGGIFIVGASGHGEVVADALLSAGKQVGGYLDDFLPIGTLRHGGSVLGGVRFLASISNRKHVEVVVAIGDNFVREACIEKIRKFSENIIFPPVVHPLALVSPTAVIEEGAVLLSGALVGVKAHVGAFCILNTAASLDHHSVMQDYSSLGPKTVTGGMTLIKRRAAVGIGACIMQGREVGRDSIVGAMALVYHDIPDQVIAYGQPAKVISIRDSGRPYLTKPKA